MGTICGIPRHYSGHHFLARPTGVCLSRSHPSLPSKLSKIMPAAYGIFFGFAPV